MRYWWVSQGNNYDIVMEQGILWSRPVGNGVVPQHRLVLKDMRPGDLVFHYAKGFLRAVSVVHQQWTPSPRPRGHREKKFNDGWLVRVEPVATDLDIPWHRVAELIAHGSPGPFTVQGQPARKYASPLTEDEGQRLLQEAGISLPSSPTTGESLLGRPVSSWDARETDGQALTTIRREQAHLRQHLLDGRTTAPCVICGQMLPARLLIAGHIKPRNQCTDEERMDFTAAAMLVCALGCDVLFEWGHIIVDTNGHVRPGRTAETTDLARTIEPLIGRTCTAYNDFTAENFKIHRSLVSPAA